MPGFALFHLFGGVFHSLSARVLDGRRHFSNTVKFPSKALHHRWEAAESMPFKSGGFKFHISSLTEESLSETIHTTSCRAYQHWSFACIPGSAKLPHGLSGFHPMEPGRFPGIVQNDIYTGLSISGMGYSLENAVNPDSSQFLSICSQEESGSTGL